MLPSWHDQLNCAQYIFIINHKWQIQLVFKCFINSPTNFQKLDRHHWKTDLHLTWKKDKNGFKMHYSNIIKIVITIGCIFALQSLTFCNLTNAWLESDWEYYVFLWNHVFISKKTIENKIAEGWRQNILIW